MRERLSAQINSSITLLLSLTIAVVPLFFLPIFTEFFEIPKLILLISLLLLLSLLWSISWVLKGKVLITRTPLDLPLLMLLLIIILSTFFSSVKNVSLIGSLPRVHGSAVSYVVYIFLYFLAVSHLRTKGQIKQLFLLFGGSAVIVSVITLLSYWGAYLPFPFAKTVNFTLTGSSFSTAALLSLLLPLPLISIVNPINILPKPAGLILSILFITVIVLTGNVASYIAAIAAVILVIFTVKQEELKKRLTTFAIPFIVAVVLVLLSIVPSMGRVKNPLFERRISFQKEIQLSFATSWKIAISAFRDTPILGTGPATFLFNFTTYRPIEHNNTPFWNVRFDTAHNEFLQVLATLGVLGFVALLFISATVIIFAWKGLLSHSADPLSLSLAISSLVGVVLLAVHASTLVTLTSTLAIFAMMMASNKSVSDKVEELSIGIKTSKLTDSNLVTGDLLPYLIFITFLILAGIILWPMPGRLPLTVMADFYHRKALNSAQSQAIDTYNYLITAENLNPTADLYRTDLAQTNFALANAIAVSKGPSESSPAGSLTDADKQNIQTLLSQAINEGRNAVALNEISAQNWEVLASIYRQISGVAQNALQFSLDAYGRAIQKDPFNPMLRLSVGGIYYSIKNYDLAVRFFSDAINLKPDFANAYYNLSVALRDKGDLQSAVAAGERVVALLGPKSADYKAASEYLSDLKARVATGSAQQQTQTAPAAEEQSALQKKNMPKVLDLPKKDDIATPPAVKKNANLPVTAAPSSSPSPSASTSPSANP